MGSSHFHHPGDSGVGVSGRPRSQESIYRVEILAAPLLSPCRRGQHMRFLLLVGLGSCDSLPVFFPSSQPFCDEILFVTSGLLTQDGVSRKPNLPCHTLKLKKKKKLET